MKQKQNLANFFNAQTIAVIGASATEGKVGHTIVKNILSYGYAGEVYLINPHREKILKKKCYASISEIGVKIDCVIVVVPAPLVYDVIADSVLFCKNFVVISAGFGESGLSGHNREMQLSKLAQDQGLTIIGPNCLGYIIPSLGLNASFATGMPRIGPVACISQSGALIVALLDKAEQDHVGFSSVVSIGNKMQVGVSDLISYYATDPATRVIAVYLEGVVQGRELMQSIARAVKNDKKVIILKAGQSHAAQKAIALHTGSLAGDDEVFDYALKKVGAIRVATFDDLFAMIMLSVHTIDMRPNLSFRNIGVITNAGGPGVLVTDEIATKKNIIMSELSQNTIKVLTKKLPPAASTHNPVDLLGDATVDRYMIAIAQLIRDQNVDVLLVLLTPQDHTPVLEVAKFIIETQKKTKKIIIVSFIGGRKVANAVALLRENGIAHFASPQQAINTLDHLLSKTKTYSLAFPPCSISKKEKIDNILKNMSKRRSLYFDECAQVAQIYDIPTIAHHDITKGLSAQIHETYPCVAKIDAPTILHKTDRGGVIYPINNLSELHHAWMYLRHSFNDPLARIITQPMLPIKNELIIGMKRDDIFGTVVVVGLGGIYTEFLNVKVLFIAPISLAEIIHTLKVGKLAFLFARTRGQQPYHIEAIAQIVYNVSKLGNDNSAISAIDINPLLVYNDDRGDIVVDIKIVL